ncbi:pyridoxamine 5'-phosphate oxidase family protein [Desulfovibrio psychrotolerans]|uniref:Pyridoxamine 5'-phosphate oxidase N-terminal domain-containing protein n=1 Tax=Desulfovibrio psychrotolerans TaxID=415242 RepID=A0A7J0BXC4_9BACT|nr:pyridoxamine 5'-phosphate oxidase family protein [Desulfovibrio psychrotolerans]GFM38343.1 hypothetical protein DSM19430T_30270 [Desulfovibrio psychrotolerans]
MLERMKEILHGNDLCVLATTDGCKPHASLMSYFCGPTVADVYMLTRRNTRKHSNIQNNSTISLLVDTRLAHSATPHAGTAALTVEGTATLLPACEHRDLLHAMTARLPHLTGFAQDAETVIIHVQVHLLQLLNGITDMHVIKVDNSGESI